MRIFARQRDVSATAVAAAATAADAPGGKRIRRRVQKRGDSLDCCYNLRAAVLCALLAFFSGTALALVGVARPRSRPTTPGRSFVVGRIGHAGRAPLTSLRSEAPSAEDLSAAAAAVIAPPPLSEVDVRHGLKSELRYDADLERYVYAPSHELHADEEDEQHRYQATTHHLGTDGRPVAKLSGRGVVGGTTNKLRRYVRRTPPVRFARRASARMVRILKASFLPEGVTPAYYSFVRWRVLQRFINANVNVFGTQSLLLGLGIKNRNALGLSAALNWVLKDALGKIVRMVWASKMGRKFDSDAKRWRFRSSLLYAAGNGLEVSTYVCPQFFLLFATLANCFKQMSMLTSSATRNALYNSFRDQRRQNIGDITAKGEAQIAVVDLLGIASGVCLSRAVGVSVRSVLSVWIALQVVEIFCMYHEIQSVEFSMLNFERLWQITDTFVDEASVVSEEERRRARSGGNETTVVDPAAAADALALGVPTPKEVARHERIFLPPKHLARRAIAFGSLGRAKLAPDELEELMSIFRREKFLLVVGEDVKNRGRRRHREGDGRMARAEFDARVNCHIVLHADANNADIVKSTLALALLRKKLAETAETSAAAVSCGVEGEGEECRRSRDCMDLIRQSRSETDALFPRFLNVLGMRGWATPARYMFGRVSMRAEWPIQKEVVASAPASAAVDEVAVKDGNRKDPLTAAVDHNGRRSDGSAIEDVKPVTAQ